MIYDITDPKKAQFLHYVNRRDYNQPVCTEVEDGECANGTYNPKAGDLGPESINYFTRNGSHFIAVGNEVSESGLSIILKSQASRCPAIGYGTQWPPRCSMPMQTW